MKRFTKIITLVLVLVALATAFTVVALADDTAKPYTFKGANGITKFDNEDYNVTKVLGKPSKTLLTSSTISVSKTMDGNNFVFLDGSRGTASSKGNWEFHLTYSRNPYTVYKMPILSFDFDVMTPTGSYGSTGTTEDAYIGLRGQYKNSSGTFKSAATGAIIRIPFSDLGLSKTPNEWQHVTITYEYIGECKFNVYAYINGNTTPTYTDELDYATALKDQYTNDDAYNVGHFTIYTSDNSAFSSVGLDNFKFTYFPEGYTVEDTINYIYTDDYKLPATSPVAKAVVVNAAGDEIPYASGEEAIKAALEGETVVLLDDVDGKLIIDKAITVKASLYQTEGTIITKFNFDYATANGLLGSYDEATGTYTFAKSESSYTVNFDPVCEGECDCDDAAKHKLTLSLSYEAGKAPVYPEGFIDLGMVNGVKADLLGWSTEKGGEAVDLSTLAPEAGAEIDLYPVYQFTRYAFEYIKANGDVTYHMADEFDSIMANAANGSTVKLHTDVTTAVTIKITQKAITLDLNGHAFIHENILTKTYNAVESGGKWTAGDQISSAGGKSVAAFDLINKEDVDSKIVSLSIISSVPGAEIYMVGLTRTVLMSEGSVVGDSVSYSTTHFINFSTYAYNCTINILGDITYYGPDLLYNDINQNVNQTTLNVDGVTFYQVSNSTVFIRSNEGGTYTFKNCKIFNTGNLFSNYTTDRKGRVSTLYFENCDILKLGINFSQDADMCHYKNTRILASHLAKSTLGEGVYSTDKKGKIEPGYVLYNENNTFTYDYIDPNFTFDYESGKPTYTFTSTTLSKSTSYVVKKCSEVDNSIKDARLSMFYYSNFNMALYIPVIDGMTNLTVSNFNLNEGTVKIDGNEYYVYTKDSTTAGVADEVRATLTYKVGSVTYIQDLYVSALVYAELVLEAPIAEVETKAVANMVRFIKEARLASGLAVSEKFAELEALAPLADYKDKAEYDDLGVDASALAGTSLAFAISANNAAYVIKPTAENAEVTVKYVGGEAIAVVKAEDSNTWYTTGERVYDLVGKAIEITITVDGEAITGTYSLGAYIQGTDNALAKAMYEFGAAAKEYREYLETL